jgi:hypothetical protein
MVVRYTVEGDTFRADPPENWSAQPITERAGPRPFELHPDGDRLVVSGELADTPDVDRVVLVSNFVNEIRRRLADGTRR